MCASVDGTDGLGGAGDPGPEQSHVQQPAEELQAGGGEAGEGLCEYWTLNTTLLSYCTIHLGSGIPSLL